MAESTQKPRFELRHTQGVEVSTEELLADLKRVATDRKSRTITYREYESLGRYAARTLTLRFGSWNEALKLAGFEISNELKVASHRLFENLERLWIVFGHQPTTRDLGTAQSEFSSIGPILTILRQRKIPSLHRCQTQENRPR
jgi:hypothetical protein